MLVIKDFATTILASALTAAATSVVVSDASRLPALSAGDYYYLVLQKFTDRTSVEVVKVTGAAGNTLTVVRAQAGTTAKSFAIGDYAEQRVTVGTFSEYIAQSVAGKVDKSGGYAEQSLGLLNTGDLVKATVGISYDAANGHGTILSGGEGANKATPYVALRPLGVADSSVQLKYAQDGSLILSGGSRYVETGLLSMRHPTDANGWPNAINSDANNYNNRARGKVHVNNNALYFIADAALNARRFGIQSGHEDPGYATAYGDLDLNPFGGIVRANGGVVYHTNYAPTPAAVGALALVGGTLTGPLGVRPSTGVNPLDLFSTPNPGGTSAQGVAGWDTTGATREWGVGRYATAGVAEYAYFGFGDAPWNSGLRVYGAGDLRAGAVNRLYHEGYLPTPDTLGAVPQARTINSKPLTADITLSAADVGAINKTGDTMTGNLTAPKVLVSGAQGTEVNALTRRDYVNAELAKKLNLTGGTLTGNLTAPTVLVSSAQNTSENALTRKDYVDSATALKVNKAGDTMTGALNFASGTFVSKADPAGLGATLRGDMWAFVESLDESNLSCNAYYDGAWKKFDNSTPSYKLKVTRSGLALDWSAAGQTSPIANTSLVYHQGFKPTAADVGAAPAGFGLGTYGTGISTVLGDCNLRRQSGFFQGPNIAGIPNGTGWTYLFNQAHGNAAGFFGYLAISFNCSKAWIGGQGGGTQKGPFELVKQGDRFVANNAVGNDHHQCAIEVNGNTAIDSRPGIGFHMSDRFAGTLHLWEGGDFRFHTQGLGSYAGIVTGNVNANDVYIRSDLRLKKNLVEVRDALRKVSSLTAYSYDKKQTLEATEYDKKEVGLIAQDVEQVLPEAVTRVVDSSNKDGTEILTLSNSALIALLVGAVKELSEKVKELEYGRT